MCTQAGRQRLAQFLRGLAVEFLTRNPQYHHQISEIPVDPAALSEPVLQHDIHLVIAGDVVDFLAEEPMSAFTADEAAACAKLQHALDSSPEVWPALRDFVRAGGAVTMLLGNHDIELSLGAVRQLLLRTLGPGRVELIYDNQGLALGDVLIEHGNRYDPWNCVPHSSLRELRSHMSRREELSKFTPLPGSRLVIDVMNDVKQTSKFVDLCKPEIPAAIPLLLGLQPSILNSAVDIAVLLWKSKELSFRPSSGAPTNRDYVSHNGPANDDWIGEARRQVANDELAAALGIPAARLADCLLDAVSELERREASDLPGQEPKAAQPQVDRSLASYTTSNRVDKPAEPGIWSRIAGTFDNWMDFLTAGKHIVAAARTDNLEAKLPHLLTALRALARSQREELDINHEKENYLRPARHAVSRGFSVVIYGHTHMAKRVPIAAKAEDGTETPGLYLNTGTWADLLWLPPELAGMDDSRALAALRHLCVDRGNDPDSVLRRRLLTYARIELGQDGTVLRGIDKTLQADLYLFPSGERLPDGGLDQAEQRPAGEAASA